MVKDNASINEITSATITKRIGKYNVTIRANSVPSEAAIMACRKQVTEFMNEHYNELYNT